MKFSTQPLLTADEEILLSHRVQQGDEAAVAIFVEANLGLVYRIVAQKFSFYRDQEDLISVGAAGVAKAARTYDPTRGAKFSTYAAWRIREKIYDELYQYSRLIRIPNSTLDKIRSLNRAEDRHFDATGLQATDEQLSAATTYPIPQIERYRAAGAQQTCSLDTPTGKTSSTSWSETTLGDILSDETPCPDREIQQREDYSILAHAVLQLQPNLRDILERRFGLGQYLDQPQTLQEIGDLLKRSRERVRQLEEKALAELRKIFRREATQKIVAKIPKDFSGQRSVVSVG